MVYILLGAGFETTEALTAADVLRRANIPVTLAGIGGEYVTSSHAVTVRADRPVEAVSLLAGDMVVLPGGLCGVAAMAGTAIRDRQSASPVSRETSFFQGKCFIIPHLFLIRFTKNPPRCAGRALIWLYLILSDGACQGCPRPFRKKSGKGI